MKKIIYFISCLSLLVGCSNKQSKNEDSEFLKNKQQTITVDEIDYLTIIHPNLLREIKKFTTYYYYKDKKIINVLLYNDKGSCKLTIYPDYYYFSSLNGYMIIDDKMIAFYYQEECITNWVKTEKLIKLSPPDIYPDDNSEFAEIRYDPSGKVFIINNDSMTLELIHS